MHFDIKNPQGFIERVKEVINTQFRNEDRAVFGKGPYRLRKVFERYSVDDFQWGQLTAQQRLRKVDVFKKATMNDKEEFVEEYASQCSSKQGLSLSAKDCKIDKGPLSILEVMFEKAASLIQTDGLVIPKPGSSDGSYVVAGTCNRIFCVTPGKGGSFKCDRTCINSTIKICEHVIAVAEKCGKFPDFVQWFRRSKLRPSLTRLALNGAPKSVGKKPSNKRKAETWPLPSFFPGSSSNLCRSSLDRWNC